jgi:hypothetical protein
MLKQYLRCVSTCKARGSTPNGSQENILNMRHAQKGAQGWLLTHCRSVVIEAITIATSLVGVLLPF